MKVLIVVLALFALGYYIITHHSPFQTEVTDPYYVEVRIDAKFKSGKATTRDLASFIEMNS